MSLLAALVVCPLSASAEEVRWHLKAGAAHAFGPPQGQEFGYGGGGGGSLELPLGSRVGLQASAGGLVLEQGGAPSDPNVERHATGTALFGTAGVRVRPFGDATGAWFDVGAGVLGTGDATRPVADLHLGYDFRIAKDSRWDMGPFVGFTQIVQPNDSFRIDDARIGWVGIEVSLGAPPAARSAPPPPAIEARAPVSRDHDGEVESEDVCVTDCPGEIRIVDDRIVLDDIIHFDFDSPRIRQRSMPLLKRVAAFINAHPEVAEIGIEGHADAVGTEIYNQRLSEARAASVRKALVQLGVDESRLLPSGYGRSRLKVPTALADMRNRRVEFIVHRKVLVSSAPTEGNQ